MNKTIELPEEDDFRPSAARLVESLRDTGYSKELHLPTSLITLLPRMPLT